MALPFDIDIYNGLLQGVLGVQPTGDPVNDSVYLVLLPMIVLYLFVHSVIHNSRFGSTKVNTLLMFIVAFFIVREGYYGVFAAFSMPLLIIIVLWNSVGFIFGRTKSYAGARGDPDSSREINEEGQSILAAVNGFANDAKRFAGKNVNDAMYNELRNDIRTLKTRLDENVNTFQSIASTRDGNAGAAKIVTKLQNLKYDLCEIERKINAGKTLSDEESDITKLRQKLKEVLNEEQK